VLIDWLAFSFPKDDSNFRIFNKIYNLSKYPKNTEFLPCATRIQNRFKEGLIDVDMSSKALSNYEFENLKELIFLNSFHIRRLDIAYDDRNGILSMSKIWNHLTERNYTSKFNNFTKLDSIHRSKKRTYLGETFYLGKRSSHSFIRIYNKLQESYKIFSYDTLTSAKKRLKDLKSNKNFIRVEIELKQKNADHIFRKIISEEFDPRSYLYKLIDFKIEGNGRVERKETVQFWIDFLEDIEKESLCLPKPFWSLETLEKWVDSQIAPTLYGFKKYIGKKKLLDIIENSGDRFTDLHDKKFKNSKKLIAKEKKNESKQRKNRL
jgi:hypothetical protein